MGTLYVRLGGRDTMHRIARIVFEQMRHDDILAETLDRIDHPVLMERLRHLLVFTFGGSPYYEGRSLRSDFAALLADDPHYDRFAHYFETALHAIGVENGMRSEAVAVIELMRDFMLNRQMARSA